MSLLLPTTPTVMDSGFGLPHWNAAAVTLSPAFERRPSRSITREEILEARYKHIMDARLKHIPLRLPFTRREIVGRLRENDQTVSNRQYRDRILDCELRRLTLLQPLHVKAAPVRNPAERRSRRLRQVWELLVATAEHGQTINVHREARLRSSVAQYMLSDLPGSFLADLGASTHWENAGITIAFNAEVQRLLQALTGLPSEEVSQATMLDSPSSLHEIDRNYRVFEARFSAMTQVTDSVLERRDALEYYVDLFSARDLRAFRTLRPISMASLDRAAFEELSEGLRASVQKVRQRLASEYPGGISSYRWMSQEDPFLTDFLRAELAVA